MIKRPGDEDPGGKVSLYSLQQALTHLAATVESQTVALSNLPDRNCVKDLSNKIQLFMDFHAKSLPMGLVILMFITLLGVLFGKEVIEYIFNHPLYRPGL